MAKQTFTTGQVLTAAQMTSLQQTAMGGGSTTAKTASYVLVAADAGTVVQMNAAGATTITVNTALFAAGDTVQIQNVGAGVCTVTAGTATVSTSAVLALKQYDAGSLYFNSTSAALFFAADAADNTSPLTTKGDLYGFSTLDARIPIGTNNQVLTADSAEALGLKWATPAATTPAFVGCSLKFGAGQSLSNATELKVAFDQEYFDTNTFHDNSTNNSRITIPSGYAGKYLVMANIAITAWNNDTRVSIFKNGSAVAATFLRWNAPDLVSANIFYILDCAVSDYLQINMFQSSGSTQTIKGQNDLGASSSFFQVQFLGA